MSLADDIADYIERELVITQGEHVGRPFVVLDWQREIIEALGSNRYFAFSMARGGGKSTFTAALACCAIRPDGPLFVPRGEVLLVASALKQADVVFKHIIHFMRSDLFMKDGRPVPRTKWRIADNHHDKMLTHAPTGTLLLALGSDNKRAHGRAPHLTILDEPAQWEGGGESLYNALRTGMGKQINPKLFVIGTQAEEPTHWFQKMLGSPDKRTWTKTYAAKKGDDDFDIESIRKANPSYDHLETLRVDIEAQIDGVKNGSITIYAYRAFHLNTGTPETEDRERLIDAEDWDRIIRKGPIERDGKVAVAFDLGENKSMSAAALYWAETGWLETFGAFPRKPDLKERGRRDGVETLYLDMERNGEIILSGDYKVDNTEFVRGILEKVGDTPRIGGVLADHFQATTIKQVMHDLGMDPERDLEIRRAARGPDGKEDIDAFRAETLTEHMKVKGNIALTMAVANSVISRGFNANPGLDKRKQMGRIDMVQAAVLAVGAGYRWRKPVQGAKEYSVDQFVGRW